MQSHALRQTGRSVHFPGLNALRFLAALTVVAFHAGFSVRFAGLASYDVLNRLNPQTGFLAVVFFFVLSGFLISYLLLVEEAETGEIAIGGFYLRRILRIWPLYYFVAVIAFFALPASGLVQESVPHAWHNRLLYFAILPNFAAAVPCASHLWSIGVEEQFYLCWPVLMSSTRRRLPLFCAVIIAYLTTLTLLRAAAPVLGVAKMLLLPVEISRIDAMAIGGFGAWLLFNRFETALRLLCSRWTQAATFAALAALYLRYARVPSFGVGVYAALFMIVILNVAANPRSLLRLRGRFFDELGKISYGIYMYHPVALLLVSVAVVQLTTIGWLLAVAFYALGIAATLLLAAVSYHFVEKPILNQKLRFSRVLTGDLAVERAADVAGRGLLLTES